MWRLKMADSWTLQTTVEPPRPKVSLVSKSVQPAQGASRPAIRLANPDDLPQNGRLSFFLKAETPATFSRAEKIEVAAEDNSFHVLLSFAAGDLTLQDPKTAVAMLDPLKSFGPSAFGPLRFRPVDANGVAGDWQPLADLVRIPTLKEIRCPDSPDKQCKLLGTNLFLIDSVASNAAFTTSRAGAGGIRRFHAGRAASEWHAAVSEAEGRPGGDQHSRVAGAAGGIELRRLSASVTRASEETTPS